MPKIKVKGQTLQTGKRPRDKRTDTHMHTHTHATKRSINILYRQTQPPILSGMGNCVLAKVRWCSVLVHIQNIGLKGWFMKDFVGLQGSRDKSIVWSLDNEFLRWYILQITHYSHCIVKIAKTIFYQHIITDGIFTQQQYQQKMKEGSSKPNESTAGSITEVKLFDSLSHTRVPYKWIHYIHRLT